MAHQDSAVYVHGDFSEPMSAQHNFINQYNLDDPAEAVSMYSRVMHQHTKRQLDLAEHSARRRSQGSTVASLSTQSSRGSIDSTHA